MGQNILVSTPLISWEHFLNLLEEYLEADDGTITELASLNLFAQPIRPTFLEIFIQLIKLSVTHL